MPASSKWHKYRGGVPPHPSSPPPLHLSSDYLNDPGAQQSAFNTALTNISAPVPTLTPIPTSTSTPPSTSPTTSTTNTPTCLVRYFEMPVPVPRCSESSSSSDKIIIPDLVSHCTFQLRQNPHGKKVGTASEHWLTRNGNLSHKKQKALHGLKCGLLTAMCYPDCPEYELRVCCDYLNYLFHLDNISDSMDNSGTVSTREVVIGTLRNPRAFKTTARVGVMTRE